MNFAHRFTLPLAVSVVSALCSTIAWADPPPAGDGPPLAEPAPPGAPPFAAPGAGPPGDPGLPVEPEERWAKSGRVGVTAGLFGPVGRVVGAIGYQMSRLIEIQAGLSGDGASSSQESANATASASASLMTGFMRGRAWLGRRHVALFEFGAGLTKSQLTADGSGKSQSGVTTATLHYERQGSVPLAFLAAAMVFAPMSVFA